MKELSIKEKAKRYDEAIKKLRTMRDAWNNLETDYSPKDVVHDIEYYFPELKESEDERIRKGLIAIITDFESLSLQKNYSLSREDILAWLEKQGDASRTYELGFTEGQRIERKRRLEKQGEQKPNPYSGTSFEYNGHTWGMCARDGGVEILIDGHLKGRVFTNDSNAKEMFIKALERVEEQNSKGYKLTDSEKNSWWEDFKAYTSCTIEQKPAWSEEDDRMINDTLAVEDWYAGKHRNISVKVSNWLKLLKNRVLSSSLREFDKEEGR